MRVLLAFDKFKGTLSAADAADVVAGVLRSRLPSVEVRSIALADGGDGTLSIALAHGFEAVEVPSADALGRPTAAQVGLAGSAGFIEMAATCGLAAIPAGERDGLRATSLGLGLAARSLLDQGVDDITIGLGGSLSTDGGLGLLVGLGVLALDDRGSACSPDLLGLERVHTLDLSGAHPRAGDCCWSFLTDVDSPLLGENGSARMFGPQKGLGPADVERAEAALARWAALIRRTAGRSVADVPGAGAAGGIIVGASLLGAPVIGSGAQYVAELIGLDRQLEWADLVVTGEGRFDRQSLLGKGPGLVLERARNAGLPAGLIAGSIDRTAVPAEVALTASLEELSGSGQRAMAEPAYWLALAAERLVEAPTELRPIERPR